MANSFWTEIQEAYARIAQLSPETRASFLDEHYSDRSEVRQELESLLRYQEAADRLTQITVPEVAVNMFADQEHDLIGSVVAGKYLVRRCLGASRMSEVYLADHAILEMPFALKRPAPGLRSDPEFRARLLDEARRAVSLKHENIARIHDVIESGPDMFVVMEYIEGETLRDRLKSLGRPLSADEFLPIAMECASALAAAHEKRIVHLDVKPENIMLTPAGRIKVCDFGIARKLSADSAKAIRTSEVTNAPDSDWKFAGTPAYMAPEVILSYQFDERADQFSLGIVFYEMLAGRNPFLAETVVATTARVVKDVPPPINERNPDIDAKLERIVMRLLAKEPDERYATSNELVTQLADVYRSHRRIPDILSGVREAVAESAWTKVAAAMLLLALVTAPAVWIYRGQIAQWLGVLPLPPTKIVVVLPFRVIGDSIPQPYLVGLTETVTAMLSHAAASPNVEVMPVSSVRDNGLTSAEDARRKLGANLVIEGALQAIGGEYRINLVLVDTKERKQLRGTSFAVPQLDSIRTQNQITEAAIGFLEIELASEQRSLLEIQTRNPEAYTAYLNGIGYLGSRNPDNVDRAIQAFFDALAVDSNFSLAYAGLGRAHYQAALREPKEQQPRRMERAREACEKALELNSKAAVGHVCLGTIYNGTGEYQRAVEQFANALDLESDNDEAYRGLAWSHEHMNNWEAAEGTYLKAIQVQPSYYFNYQMLGQFYLFSRQQYADAIDVYLVATQRSPENDEPYLGLCGAYILAGHYTDAVQTCKKAIGLKEDPLSYMNLGVAYWDLRDYASAAQSFERAVELNPNYYKTVGHLARTYSWLPEKRAQAPELYRKAISLADDELRVNPRDPDTHVMVARYHAMLGHRVEALSHLQEAFSIRPKDAEYHEIAAVIHNQFGETSVAIGYLERAISAGYSIGEIETERELDNLRADSRFRALISSQTK